MSTNFSKIKEGEIVLFITSETKYSSTNRDILRKYINRDGNYCVYVTVNKAYTTLVKYLETNKIRTDRILFIDAITPVSSETRSGNAIFVGNPKALTSISLTLSYAMKGLPEGKRLLFLDSISTLMIYNDLRTLSKFSNFIINKMREWNFAGVIISIEKEKSDEISKYLSQIVDRVVELK
jgi:KaiC/GvpD/RAD55 family RecA-like ATPase